MLHITSTLANIYTDPVIFLNLLRTITNRLRCTFPGCTRTNGLHDISRLLRFKALKNKVYIPNRARVCARHMTEDRWNTLQGEGKKYKFTAKQINEMINLFCDSSKNITVLPCKFSRYTFPQSKRSVLEIIVELYFLHIIKTNLKVGCFQTLFNQIVRAFFLHTQKIDVGTTNTLYILRINIINIVNVIVLFKNVCFFFNYLQWVHITKKQSKHILGLKLYNFNRLQMQLCLHYCLVLNL